MVNPQDREIRQLTDEKDSVVMQPHWFDLDGRSLASRAASVNEVLSDGCLSDSAMDSGVKGGKKKKKSWKVCGCVRANYIILCSDCPIQNYNCNSSLNYLSIFVSTSKGYRIPNSDVFVSYVYSSMQ